jgi:hypothetical protein
MIGLLFCYVDNEVYFTNNKVNSSANHVLRFFVIVFTLILAGSIYLNYNKLLEQLAFTGYVNVKTSLMQCKSLRSQFLFELLVNSIIYPPFLDLQINHNFNRDTYQIPANAYIFMFMLLRLYILLKVL